MLKWIKENKEWVFSGIGVTLVAVLGSWVWSSLFSTPITPTPSPISANISVTPDNFYLRVSVTDKNTRAAIPQARVRFETGSNEKIPEAYTDSNGLAVIQVSGIYNRKSAILVVDEIEDYIIGRREVTLRSIDFPIDVALMPISTPTSTQAPLPTPTDTPIPTETPSPIPPTDTSTPTETPIPSDTPTPTATATETPSQTPTSTPTEAKPKVTANDSAVNLRTGPGTNYDISGTLAQGQSLEIVGRIRDSSWWLVRTPYGEKWIYSNVTSATNLSEDIPIVTPPPIPTPINTPTPTFTLTPTNTPTPPSTPTVPIETLGRSLHAYYPFNGNSKDLSGNNYHLKVIGAQLTSDRNGSSNQAYFFNGDDYMVSNFPPLIQGRDEREYTVALWFKPSLKDGGLGALIHRGDAGACLYEPIIEYRSSENTIQATVSGCGATGLFAKDITIDPNVWHHIVITVGNQSQQLYIDSVHVATGNVPPRYGISDNLFIGVLAKKDAPDAHYYYGALDEVRIYSRILSEIEVEMLFNLD